MTLIKQILSPPVLIKIRQECILLPISNKIIFLPAEKLYEYEEKCGFDIFKWN